MLRFENNSWHWMSAAYDTFSEAFSAMVEDVAWNGAKPGWENIEYSKLSGLERRQLLLYAGIYVYDLPSIVQSKNYIEYSKMARTNPNDGFLKELVGTNNSLDAVNFNIPTNYQENRGIQVTAIPGLAKKYDAYPRRIKTKRGRYNYSLVLSYIIDTVLFNPKNTPFHKCMDVFTTLEGNDLTRGIVDHMNNDDLLHAYVLSLQVKAGDLTGEDFISVGSMRKHRYPCKTKDEIYGKQDYFDIMTALPKVSWSNDFYDWLDTAASANGISLNIQSKNANYEIKQEHKAYIIPEYLNKLFDHKFTSDELDILSDKFPEYMRDPKSKENTRTGAEVWNWIRNSLLKKEEPEQEPAPIQEFMNPPEPVREEQKSNQRGDIEARLQVTLTDEQWETLNDRWPDYVRDFNSTEEVQIKTWLTPAENTDKEDVTLTLMCGEIMVYADGTLTEIREKQGEVAYRKAKLKYSNKDIIDMVHSNAKNLRYLGYKNWESIYRAIPQIIINEGGAINVDMLRVYKSVLKSIYGSDELAV